MNEREQYVSQEADPYRGLKEQITILSAEQRVAIFLFLTRIQSKSLERQRKKDPVISAALLASLIEIMDTCEGHIGSIKASLNAADERIRSIMAEETARLSDLSYEVLRVLPSMLKYLTASFHASELFLSKIKYIAAAIVLVTGLTLYAGLTTHHHREACARARRLPLALVEMARHEGKVRAEKFFLEPSSLAACR